MSKTNKMGKRVLHNATFVTIIAIIITFFALVVYGYFSTKVKLYTNDGQTTYFSMGMELNTFFDIIDSTQVSKGTSLGITCTDTNSATGNVTQTDGVYTYNSAATWGSASNPYIISKKAHLQNLYVLQNCGYFEQSIETNSSGNYTEASIPYFLVCTNTGGAVTIDCSGATIEPIGNENYPFYGYFGGAFSTTNTTVTINSKTCDQSVIYNAKVQTTEDVIDVGLFGHVGYLGTMTEKTTFNGVVSTISDVLLYDVQVVVKELTIFDKIANAITSHFFSFKTYSKGTLTSNDSTSVPHENHHIGIVAGHVELATVEYVSVYYSNDNIAALDVQYNNTSINGNFKSVSGILGFCYEMNSESKDGVVTIGGISNDDIEVSGTGVGTGGGLISGTGRGYVTAKEVYNGYDDAGNILHYIVDGLDCYSLLVIASDVKGSSGITYTLPDGSPVTLALIDSDDATKGYKAEITSTYTQYVSEATTTDDFDEIVVRYPDGAGGYKYWHKNITQVTKTLNDSTTDIVEYTGLYLRLAAGINAKNEYEKLCTQYVRSRIISGEKETKNYYFYDGVFTFALSDADDEIVETWSDGVENNQIYVGVDNDASWTKDSTGGDGAVVAFIKQVKSTDELNAARTAGKQIFIVYQDTDGNHLVTLAENSSYESGQGNNAVLTKQTTLQFVSDTLKTKLISALNAGTMESNVSGVSATQLADGLSGDNPTYLALNIGASTELESTTQLKEKYGIDIGYQTNENTTYIVNGSTSTTENVTSLDTAAKAIGNTKYLTDTTTYENGSKLSYFLPSTMSTSVNIDNISTAISSKNSAIYRDDWSTEITNSEITSAISNNTAITQTEMHTYSGFYYYEYDLGWFTQFTYYYVNSSGKKTECDSTWNSGPSSVLKVVRTDSNGIVIYKYGSYGEGPVLRKATSDGTYYHTTDMSISGNYSNNDISTVSGGNVTISYTATYNYFIATQSASGITYTVNGTSTAANKTPTATGKIVSSINGYTIPTTGSYDYPLYSDGTTTGILITKYSLNGYITKTMTGTGVKYYLNGDSSNELTLNSGEPSVFKNAKGNTVTITVDENNYTVYKAGGTLGVLVSNYQLDGVIVAETSNGVTSYSMYGDSAMKGATLNELLDKDGNNIKISISGTEYKLYICGGKLGVLASLDKSEGYFRFSSKSTYTLRILYRRYIDGGKYSIICSTDDYVSDENKDTFSTDAFLGLGDCLQVDNSKNATVTFANDGSCRISYTVQSNTYYLNYNSTIERNSLTGWFNSNSSSTESTTKMYIYTVEGTHEVSNGRIIVPTDEGEIATLSAGSYVLWPDTEKSETTTYTIKQLQQSVDGVSVTKTVSSDDDYLTTAKGWKAADGNSLNVTYLSKKFAMGDGISDVSIYSLFNGNISLEKDARYVKAPIGTTGEEAFIPSGCVAFRINESGTENKIRVIVAVPQTTMYVGETINNTSYSLTDSYYFGMWKINAAGEDTSITIGIDNAQTWIYLPKSTEYNPVSSISDANPSGLKVNYNGTTRRTYLNGDKILVAYEFSASEEGVYLLGCSQKCEIVYFSADATAGSGQDGSTSYKMGTIDFVYDNGSKILTVKDSDSDNTDARSYSTYYYQSLSLLYTDNTNSLTAVLSGDTDLNSSFANINDFTVYVRRTLLESSAGISWRATGGSSVSGGICDAAYIQCVRYGLDADTITRTADASR